MKAFNEKKKSKKENETPHLDGWLGYKKKRWKLNKSILVIYITFHDKMEHRD